MVELGGLEKNHDEFAKRNIDVVVVANDEIADAKKTQEKFPHLKVVADTHQDLAKAVQVIHTGMGPGQTDTNVPTTFLVDGSGKVRWLFRPTSIMRRLSPEELLAAVDKNK